VDENARLRVELDATNRRLALLTEQFAEAHRLRLDALAEAEAARGSNAKLEARLRQRGQAADEALMRADKAEKLYAALEEAHVRISTENERLTRDLASARERQAETTRRLVELDSLLASAQARALPGAETERASSETPAERASAEPRGTSDVTETGSDGDAGQPLPVIYRVRADDTLSGISNKVYGNPNDWPRIFEANRDLLQTPDDLALGMSLVIP
jgi:nucleoid-associated protein YgaU